ncbi:hypothetical protein AX15_005336 [Amanita polypyramis BW_CC]|nr:hypothetical protein AX15_005336 [Amanita polypyramis BW_CC]
MLSSSPGYDAYAHYACYLLELIDKEIKKAVSNRAGEREAEKREAETTKSEEQKSKEQSGYPTQPKPVGILGAGACGLYTAMILEDLGIPYRILEARRRVGGRLFTYNFPNSFGQPYNYFDIGAMRFPKIPAMSRIFSLFDNPNLNTPDINLKDRLGKFYFSGDGIDQPFLYYNGIRKRQGGELHEDAFKASEVLSDGDREAYIKTGVATIVDDVIRPYATALLDDLKNGTRTGLEKLMSVDDCSMRTFMSFKYKPTIKTIPDRPLPTDVVNWCETFDKSTGWYDRAFSETILEAIAFGWTPDVNTAASDDEGTEWYLIKGGSQKIADAMATYINKQNPNAIVFDERVTSIALTDPKTVTVGTFNHKQHEFSHVISSLPLPILRIVDLGKAKLSPKQSNALRHLNYGPSIKIGMQFRTAWWRTGKDRQGNILGIVGGQTYTDSPLRTVVYPSFGDIHDGKTTTLIASYCWTEDASRLGALIDRDDGFLAEVVLKELSIIHDVDYEFLRNDLIDLKGWSWSHDPLTCGAFAFFGPGDFKEVYGNLNTPAADGRLHFAGEALSVRHAWVEGALDSAWRAVAEMLTAPEFTRAQRRKFQQDWGRNPEWFPSEIAPKVPSKDTEDTEEKKKPKGVPEGASPKAPGKKPDPIPSDEDDKDKDKDDDDAGDGDNADFDIFGIKSLIVLHLALTEAYEAL